MYQYGDMAYWESIETYPCDPDLWGDLAGQPIRHHKFPDVLVSPIFESHLFIDESSMVMERNAVIPLGIKVDVSQIVRLIESSDLSEKEKSEIIGFKIVRGNRDVNKSIVAKGILRNVGKYTREGNDYYFPNYPYNDLREDPFLLENSNAFMAECFTFRLTATTDINYSFTDCLTGKADTGSLLLGEVLDVCSVSTPIITSGTGVVLGLEYDTYTVTGTGGSGFAGVTYNDYIDNLNKGIPVSPGMTFILKVTVGSVPYVDSSIGSASASIVKSNDPQPKPFCYPNNLQAFDTDESKYRFVLNSPETSFGQPFLGSVLKLENILYGKGKAHFVPVKDNAFYKLLTKEAQEDALLSATGVGNTTSPFNATAMFTAYQAYLSIYINGITRKNYGWSYNSVLERVKYF